jgi:hypothetical protein
MRRILLVALLGVTVVALPGSAVAAKKHHAKPATFKTGTYKAKVGAGATTSAPFNITLKRASCPSAPGQGTSSLHLCVALPASPIAACSVPVNFEVPLGGFMAPVALPTSGTLTQQAPVTAPGVVPGAPPTTGQSSFSVTFTKKGTASGYLELNLEIAVTPTQPLIPCSSGKVPFTAKLG